jgi:hypothetical protein
MVRPKEKPIREGQEKKRSPRQRTVYREIPPHLPGPVLRAVAKGLSLHEKGGISLLVVHNEVDGGCHGQSRKVIVGRM